MKLDGEEEQAMNLDGFLAIVKKYPQINELTPTILNEFMEKIIVHAQIRELWEAGAVSGNQL